MKYTGVLYVEKRMAKRLERFCEEPPGRENCAGKDVSLFDEEYVFPNGNRMAIQVCPSTDPDEESCWTQGVVFAPNGEEIGCTDCGESLLGEFSVFVDEDEYTVDVQIGTKQQLAEQKTCWLRNGYVAANRIRDLWFTDGKNSWYFPRGWCDDFTVANHFSGGPDFVDDGEPTPELYGYAPTHTKSNSDVETMFVAMKDLAKLTVTTREKALKIHPKMKKYLVDIDAGK